MLLKITGICFGLIAFYQIVLMAFLAFLSWVPILVGLLISLTAGEKLGQPEIFDMKENEKHIGAGRLKSLH